MRIPADGLPRLSSNAFTRSTAAAVKLIAAGRGRGARFGLTSGAGVAATLSVMLVPVSMILMLLRRLFGRLAVLLAIVLDRGLDGVLGQDRAMDLHRRQRQMLRDHGVLDGLSLVESLALDPLGRERGRGDRRAAAEGLEPRILDAAIGADLDLQLHHVAAGRCADEAGADAGIALVQRADIARVLVVVDQFLAICHVYSPKIPSRLSGPVAPISAPPT